jgi:hypothetical protein
VAGESNPVPSRSRMVPSGRRQVVVIVAAWLVAVAAVLAPATAPLVRAAGDGLELATAATYTIAPARHAILVAVDVTARNNKPNVSAGGVVTKYFYEGARVAIQLEATNVRATSGGVRLTPTMKPADGYSVLEVRFRSSLFYHQSTTVHVTFDLPGGAPRSKSDIRVGTAFATFVAWAFGDGGSVKVVVPAGFDAEATGSDAAKSTSGGKTVFRATGITDTASWYLAVNADRKSALTNDRLDLGDGEHILIRAWPEDAKWKKQVSDLLARGLPELVDQIGLAWPVAGDLAIFEVHTPLLEGYAGVFFQGQDRIEVSEDLDDLTIIHEASHAWFNSDLFDGRWINEGLADTYAARTLDGLGDGSWAPDPVSPTDRAAVRLADWVHPGRISDNETEAREQYGYDASWTVIRSILTEIDEARMQDVLKAAQAHEIAYVGAGTPETVTGSNDWRRLLDLLDEVGHSQRSDELFRSWVVTPAQAGLLDERATARTAYAALVTAGGVWRAPFYVRGPLGDWSFQAATDRIAQATGLLGRRDGIAAIAAPLGVSVPGDLRGAYEAARDSLDEANHIADAETAAVRALATATEAVGAARAPLMTLGLLGTAPEADLSAARLAFSAGTTDALARALAVTALIDGAVSIGRGRFIAAIAIVVAIVVLLVIAFVVIRRRRRQRLALELAATGGGAAGGGEAPGGGEATAAGDMPVAASGGEAPYATLADPTDERDATDAETATDASGPPPADTGDAS